MLKVLVVEDFADTARLLVSFMQICGYSARHAADGHTAVSIARDWQPEVVLLDIGLPGMDGYAVAKTLRQDAELSKTKIYALSGFAPDEEKQKACGIDQYFMKPVDFVKLQKLVGC